MASVSCSCQTLVRAGKCYAQTRFHLRAALSEGSIFVLPLAVAALRFYSVAAPVIWSPIAADTQGL